MSIANAVLLIAPGTGSITANAGVNAVILEAWGSGAGGTLHGNGGGGAGFAKKTVPVSPGQTITYTLPSGGAVGANGATASFSIANVVVLGASGGTRTGGGGPLAGATVGFYGAAGFPATGGNFNDGYGGGSATSTANGSTHFNQSGASSVEGGEGGLGVNDGAGSSAPPTSPGGDPGGGGGTGGGTGSVAPQPGGRGQLRYTFIFADAVTSTANVAFTTDNPTVSSTGAHGSAANAAITTSNPTVAIAAFKPVQGDVAVTTANPTINSTGARGNSGDETTYPQNPTIDIWAATGLAGSASFTAPNPTIVVLTVTGVRGDVSATTPQPSVDASGLVFSPGGGLVLFTTQNPSVDASGDRGVASTIGFTAPNPSVDLAAMRAALADVGFIARNPIIQARAFNGLHFIRPPLDQPINITLAPVEPISVELTPIQEIRCTMADGYPITKIDITHKRGDTFDRNATIGADLTGYTLLHMQVREDYDSKKVYADITDANGITVTGIDTDNAITSVNLLISAAVTDLMPVEKLAYDLKWIDPMGEVRTVLEGDFVVTGNITRP